MNLHPSAKSTLKGRLLLVQRVLEQGDRSPRAYSSATAFWNAGRAWSRLR
jgi:hypothetical protein